MAQEGVISRAQALAEGLTDATIEANLSAGRWQRLLPGVYAMFTGPLPRLSRLWAAVLWAGRDAVLSHESAAELAGFGSVIDPIHVSVPTSRRVRSVPGVVVHRRAGLIPHPVREPPQTRVEDTVMDLTQTAENLDKAFGWITRAIGARATTADRLAQAFVGRSRLRWRSELTAAIGDVRAGCHSLLELRYKRDVERAHRLPTGSRQDVRRRAGGRFYDDVRYDEYLIIVELDGRAAHPDATRWRDVRRDNVAAAGGHRVLRYGWAEVVGDPCAVALQVGSALRAGGWSGALRSCGRTFCRDLGTLPGS